MKTFIILLGFILTSFFGFSQDVIYKRDGGKIDAKVIEVTPTTIKYKRWDQQTDGPMRSIPVSQVKEIIYNDGTWDKFEGKPTPAPTEVTRPTMSEPKPDKDVFFNNGINLDLCLGAGLNKFDWLEYIYNPNTGLYDSLTTTRTDSYFSLNLRLGTKFYIGGGAKWRPGIQANWIRFGVFLDPDDFSSIFIGPKNIAPVNIGMANIFKFSEELGMEANFTTGFNLEINPDAGRSTYGIAIAPEIKFRYKQLAVGLDYLHIFGLDSGSSMYAEPGSWDIIGISIGAKF